MNNKIIKFYVIPISIAIISILFGIIFNDFIWGVIALASGFLNAYYMAIGKWYNYIFGLIFAIVNAYICTINGLYGLLIFTIIFYIPLQIVGLINWIRHNESNAVQTRSLNLIKSIYLCTIIIVTSCILGFLLTLIPGQNLAFLDSTSQIINLCGVFMGILRYRESWYIWLLNNVVDLTIWITNTIRSTPNAEMMLMTSIMYLGMNIIGIINWIKIEKNQNIIG